MRYHENKEQSSELLRLALPLMARQTAALHPVSYCLWYEHVGGLNPALSEVLAPRLEAHTPLSEDEVYRLHARYISARDVQMLEALQQQMHLLLEDTARTAAAAGEDTGLYGKALAQGRIELNGALSLEGLQYVINRLLSETERMETSTLALAEKLDARAEEIRELTDKLDRAQTEALLDPLCGINNRRGFERAAAELANSSGDLDGAALLLADVDHFKQVNDTYGHLLGDRVLKMIAQTIRANIKGRDVAARIGGEEFAILLPQTTLRGAEALAEQLRLAIARGRIRKGKEDEIGRRITVSIGLAVARASDDLEALMERADAALYRAKNDGRNLVRSL